MENFVLLPVAIPRIFSLASNLFIINTHFLALSQIYAQPWNEDFASYSALGDILTNFKQKF